MPGRAVTIQCHLDAENRQLLMRFVDPATGLLLGDLPQVLWDLRDLLEATQIDEDHVIESIFRQVHFTDANDGTAKRCWVPATIPESDATPLESADPVEDLYLGGGGSGGGISCHPYLFVSMAAEHVVCTASPPIYALSSASVAGGGTGYHVGDVLSIAGGTGTSATVTVTSISGGGGAGPITGVSITTGGAYTAYPATPYTVTDGSGTGATLTIGFTANTVNIAKLYKMRASAQGVTVDGQTVAYSAYDWTNQKRTAACGGSNTYEVITPRYCPGDIIYADGPISTGVTVSDVQLTLLERCDGRAWSKKYVQS